MAPHEGSIVDGRAEFAAAERHARETVFPVAAGRRCIDSRYEPGQGSGMIARPGADFGYVMALLAVNHAMRLGLTPARVVDAVWDAVANEGDRFRIHTDWLAPWPTGGAQRSQLSGSGPPAIGCRHIAAAADPARAAAYFLPSHPAPAADVVTALARVAERALVDGGLDVVTLREHRDERGVLVVVGTRRTVQPSTPRAAYYVYDQARDEAFMARTLVPRLGIPGLGPEELAATASRQLGASLRLVAPGRPVFLVDVDGVVPEVVYAGQVEGLFPANLTER